MTNTLAEAIKQAGAAAFSRCLGMSTFDVLADDQLAAELFTLWDCETLESLQARVAANGNQPAAEAYLKAVCARIGGQRSRPKPERLPQPAPGW